MINNRQLGSGFGIGNEFSLFRNESYRGLMNELTDEQTAAVHAWMTSDDNRDITAILDPHTLALIIPDLLVDLEATRLMKILPELVALLPEEVRALFSNQETLDKLDKRFLLSLQKSLPNELGMAVTSETLAALLAKDQIANVAPALLAYLIPAILDLMEGPAFEATAIAIAKQLKKKDFRAVADKAYFTVQMHETDDDSITLQNNARTLLFRANSSKNHALFRSKDWQLDHTHLHLEGNGEEREYQFFQNREEFRAVKEGSKRDPNLDIVGELHTVYKRESKRGNIKYMAVGLPLVIGKHNADFENILAQVARLEHLTQDEKLQIVANYKNMFMPTFTAAQNRNALFYHSWGSLKSQTHAFRAGLRFVISPDPVEISAEQYARFKQLFGDMAPLSEEKVLEPIDRKADHRIRR